jgi:hypothetical protein
LGEAKDITRVTDLLTIRKLDGLMITAISASNNRYYEALFGNDEVLLSIGNKLPIEVDLDPLPIGLKRIVTKE